MAVLLSLINVNKEFGQNIILNNISFDIEEGDRIGLVGLNGSGKTTLANIICGGIKFDKGSIKWYKENIKVGYLKQDGSYTQKIIDEYHNEVRDEVNIKDFLQISSCLNIKRDINPLSQGELNSLSGGEKMKLALANILSYNPNFLILDEPTNYIDYEGMQWIIEKAKSYKGTLLIISHDRYFLDSTVNKVIEIYDGVTNTYYGNYSFYRDEKKRRYESEINQYNIQQYNKLKIEKEINKLKEWSQKAHKDSTKKQAVGLGKKEYFRAKAKKRDKQVKSKIKQLEKLNLEGIKKPKEDKRIDFKFNNAILKGTRIIEAFNIEKGFSSRILFKDSSFYIMRGERVGIFGPNGCGKTTLLKILLDKEKLDKGDVFLSKSVSIGYLSQEGLDIDEALSVIEMFDIKSRQQEGRLRKLLNNMGFDENMIGQKVSTLSYGEITRVRITKLIIKDLDLLIMDEPLNHLDIYSREKLEEALKDYEGTIILVSHDRYMIENLCNCLLVFKDNKIKKILGDPREHFDKIYVKEKENIFKSNKNQINHLKDAKDKKMLIENEISYVLGELSRLSKDSKEYNDMDKKFKDLINDKKKLDY